MNAPKGTTRLRNCLPSNLSGRDWRTLNWNRFCFPSWEWNLSPNEPNGWMGRAPMCESEVFGGISNMLFLNSEFFTLVQRAIPPWNLPSATTDSSPPDLLSTKSASTKWTAEVSLLWCCRVLEGWVLACPWHWSISPRSQPRRRTRRFLSPLRSFGADLYSAFCDLRSCVWEARARFSDPSFLRLHLMPPLSWQPVRAGSKSNCWYPDISFLQLPPSHFQSWFSSSSSAQRYLNFLPLWWIY